MARLCGRPQRPARDNAFKHGLGPGWLDKRCPESQASIAISYLLALFRLGPFPPGRFTPTVGGQVWLLP